MTEWQLTPKQMAHINDKSRELMIEGSAGSGKTIFACTKTIFYALEHINARIGVFRATLPALKKTAWLEIRNMLIDHKIPYHENKSEGTITLEETGSVISFSSLDDLKKVRSLNLDFVYIEQAEEVDRDTYVELTLRVRNLVSRKDYGQILSVVQPEGTDHWLYEYFYTKELGKHIHFHYKENPALPEAARRYYDTLKEVDYELWHKYSAGKWGKLSNLIFENWDNKERSTFKFYTAGVDFGYNSPACFLLIGWYDDEPYVIDEIYQREMTIDEFIRKAKYLLMEHNLGINDLDMVYADSASPDYIEEFDMAGFPMSPSVKNVEAKINAVKQTKVHIAPTCVNTIKEIKAYKWQVDKNKNILDKPVKVNDHAMDALAYCVYGVRGALSPDKLTGLADIEEVYVY